MTRPSIATLPPFMRSEAIVSFGFAPHRRAARRLLRTLRVPHAKVGRDLLVNTADLLAALEQASTMTDAETGESVHVPRAMTPEQILAAAGLALLPAGSSSR